jgi:hypothetical protein
VRDPRSTSWMRFAFASFLLLMTLSGPLWFRGDVVGEGLLAHALLSLFLADGRVAPP